MQMSDHAYKRLHERSGLNQKASVRLAERALARGYHRRELHGGVRKLEDIQANVCDSSEKDCVVYGDKLFVFKEKRKVLITVLQIPANLTKDLKVYVKKGKQ